MGNTVLGTVTPIACGVTPGVSTARRHHAARSRNRAELGRLMRKAQRLGAADYIAELWDIAGRPALAQSKALAAIRRDLADSAAELAAAQLRAV